MDSYGGGSIDGFIDSPNSTSLDDHLLEENDDASNEINKTTFTVLKEADIRQRMDDLIVKASTVLSISKPEASIVLRYFNWSFSKVTDVWFADESGIRQKLGFVKTTQIIHSPDGPITCGICFDSFSLDEVKSTGCCHYFCKECWSGYISTSINSDGLLCLALRCPDPSCQAAVDQDMVFSLVSEEDRIKYLRCLVKSYVEENKKINWCPGVNCECAIEFCAGDNGSFDVTCQCSTSFCWNCTEETHRPLDCDTVKKWVLKNRSESENVNYILAYCKPCPNCKRPIEKNEGCMNMRCRVCSHSFCWLCLRPLNNHGSCNSFEAKNENLDARKKRMAKQSLEKYTHYFERWDANRRSKLQALADLQQVMDVQFKKLSQVQDVPEARLDFIRTAWLQVVECRRVLEWSYAYGYFLPDDDKAKKQFFEYLQGEAESGLEKLHNYMESEMQKYIEADGPSLDFSEFRVKLLGLTTVTRNYFDKLVTALENGLSDEFKARPSSSKVHYLEDDCWSCDRCTFLNPLSAKRCRICLPSDAEDQPTG